MRVAVFVTNLGPPNVVLFYSLGRLVVDLDGAPVVGGGVLLGGLGYVWRFGGDVVGGGVGAVGVYSSFGGPVGVGSGDRFGNLSYCARGGVVVERAVGAWRF